jgi:hypothetical protein
LVPIRFLSYQFYLLLFVVCFAVVFVVDNDCQKISIIGTDRKEYFPVVVVLAVRVANACNPKNITQYLANQTHTHFVW